MDSSGDTQMTPRNVPSHHARYINGAYANDRSVEPELKKRRILKNKNESKNKNRRISQRKITFPEVLEKNETETLRSELSSVHETYLNLIQDKDKEIDNLKQHLIIMSNSFAEDVDALHKKEEDLQQDLDITEGELTIYQKSEKKWIGISLKLKFILDEIKKICALPEDHAEWVDPMVEDVVAEIPEVSVRIKNEFIPTTETDNIDWVDDEEDGEGGWTDDGELDEYEEDIIAAFSRIEVTSTEDDFVDEFESTMNLFNPRLYYSEPRAILEKSAKTIQKAFRNYFKRKLDKELDDMKAVQDIYYKQKYYATMIQCVWRGYNLRKMIRNVSKDMVHIHIILGDLQIE